MNRYLNPRLKDYSVRWQSEFSAGASKCGAAQAMRAQRYVSNLRAMRRRLLAGGRPRLLDFRAIPKTNAYHFVLKRNLEKFDRAFARGETTQTIRRRGLMDPLGRHRLFCRQPKRR